MSFQTKGEKKGTWFRTLKYILNLQLKMKWKGTVISPWHTAINILAFTEQGDCITKLTNLLFSNNLYTLEISFCEIEQKVTYAL